MIVLKVLRLVLFGLSTRTPSLLSQHNPEREDRRDLIRRNQQETTRVLYQMQRDLETQNMSRGRKPRSNKGPNYPLRQERERRGWSQSRLAEAIGATSDMVSRWERGERGVDYI